MSSVGHKRPTGTWCHFSQLVPNPVKESAFIIACLYIGRSARHLEPDADHFSEERVESCFRAIT